MDVKKYWIEILINEESIIAYIPTHLEENEIKDLEQHLINKDRGVKLKIYF